MTSLEVVWVWKVSRNSEKKQISGDGHCSHVSFSLQNRLGWIRERYALHADVLCLTCKTPFYFQGLKVAKSTNNPIQTSSHFFFSQHAPGVPRILVGNRLHLAFKRQVPTEQARAYAEKNGMTFFEVSPLCNFNVIESFTELSRIVLMRHGMEKFWRPNRGGWMWSWGHQSEERWVVKLHLNWIFTTAESKRKWVCEALWSPSADGCHIATQAQTN